MGMTNVSPIRQRSARWNAHKIEILRIGMEIGWPYAAVAVLVDRPLSEVRDVAWSLKKRRAS